MDVSVLSEEKGFEIEGLMDILYSFHPYQDSGDSFV